MLTYNGNFPNLAIFLPDKDDSTNRIPFKCRVAEENTQFFSYNSGGLVDIGTNLAIITPKRFELQNGAKVILDGIRYSIQSITPFIPDSANKGPFNRKINAEYLIQLG